MHNEEKIQAVEHALDGHMEPIPDYGDLVTLHDFVEWCNNGAVVNYDGSGYYATKTMISRDNRANPSDICAGKIDWSWTHVMWFNK